MTFDQAFERLLGHEGGYVNNPHDPGGETKFGISKRSYPGEDIAGLTEDRAKQIYFRDYWGPAGCDSVPDGLRFELFDMAVNSGVRAAIKTLQSALGETADGVLGPLTIQAANSINPLRAAAKMSGARLAMMADLPTWPAFGRGWAKRIAANLQSL
jgi:lysozyme family protein